MTAHRDARTGRYARRPVPNVDAESAFDPAGDSIENIKNVSGARSPNTIERPRYAPAGDELAQGGQGSPLRARRPELVHPDDADHTIYGTQGAVLRAAARGAGPMDPSPFLTGLAARTAPPAGIRATRAEVHGDHNPLSPGADLLRSPAGRAPGRVRDITDDGATGTPGGDLRSASRGLGRGRDR